MDARNPLSSVGVVGLGYVGLPLAVEFGKTRRTIGYDESEARVEACRLRNDPSREVASSDFAAADKLVVTSDAAALGDCEFVIVAVPTPVDGANRPDLSSLIAASQTVGRHLKRGAVVIYESTVFPGATEDVCVPVLEKNSGMRWKTDFHVGYSPERINPGDKARTLAKIVKVVSGDSPATLDRVAALYESIVAAGVHRASSIRVAEAAKVIENTQRDLNIALMNELAMIFDRMGIETAEVLEAAATKWNFLKFIPGLVGGHCIGVDPYYLTHKAEMLGYHPQVILAGRHINDGMGKFIAEKTIKLMVAAGCNIKGARVNVLGLTFKENCSDIRNSKVPDIVRELESFGVQVAVHDPLASDAEAFAAYGIHVHPRASLSRADALVLAVAHDEYRSLQPADLLRMAREGACVIDVKSALGRDALTAAGFRYWRL